MKWSTQNQSQKQKKSRGLPRRSKLTFSERHELNELCERIASIAASANNAESLVILEAALVQLIKHIDAESRSILFKSVNIVLEAKEYANQRNIITPQMITALTDDKENIQIGIIAQNLVDSFFERADKYKIDKKIIDNIIKVIVVRLSLELDHNTLREVSTLLLPNMLEKKEQEDMRSMYG